MSNSIRPQSDRPRISRTSSQLVRLAKAWSASGSRHERLFWEHQIQSSVAPLLAKSKDRELEQALDILAAEDLSSFEILLDLVYALTEHTQVTREDKTWDCLMITAPFLVWTKYRLPTDVSASEPVQKLLAGLKEIVLAPGVRVCAIPHIFSPYEMPHTLSGTWRWLRELSSGACIDQANAQISRNIMPEGFNLLADSRHLVLVASVEQGQPIFKWQVGPKASRDTCLKEWVAFSEGVLGELFTGCQFRTLLPDSFRESITHADRELRSISITASVDWLQIALDRPAGELRATIMAFGESEPEEFRIGFSVKGQTEVFYGNVWPVLFDKDLSKDDSDAAEVEQITATLKQAGITDVRYIPGVAPPEYCNGCSAPLFANPHGEIVHAEMPEEASLGPQHFH